MANNNSDNFKPGKLHLTQKLLNREIIEPRKKADGGRKKRRLEISTFDVSADFHALGFSCVGITLTADNTGIWKNGTPGRLTNKELAQALKKSLYTLVKRTLSTIPIWATWVYERHKNGSPHIHAMLFCPVRDVFRLSQKCKKICNDRAVIINVLSPDYIFKFEKMSYEWDLVETSYATYGALCKKLIGRTVRYYDEIKKKYVRRNVSKIKDLQKTKELFDVCNSKLRKKYPSAEGILQSLFFELWRFWKYSHCRPKKERVADNPDLCNSLILESKKQSESVGSEYNDECLSSTDETLEYEEDEEPFPVTRFVIMQPNLGCFGRDVACKLKTRVDDDLVQLDVTLWTKNNTERLHVNLKNVYLSSRRIQNLKLWAKKCRDKNDLLVLYRTLFSGMKISGRDPLRMLDFSPKDLLDSDRELITPRYDICSWLGHVAPRLKNNQNLLILILILPPYSPIYILYGISRAAKLTSVNGVRNLLFIQTSSFFCNMQYFLAIMFLLLIEQNKESIMESDIQKPNQSQNVALAQTQSQKTAQPQELKPAEQKEKKELSPRAKLIKDLNALVAKLKSIDKRETKAKNALEAAKNAVAKIEE